MDSNELNPEPRFIAVFNMDSNVNRNGFGFSDLALSMCASGAERPVCLLENGRKRDCEQGVMMGWRNWNFV
ncbi:hypothetical protein [Luteolibacter sp. LG18]|uniref:hypothetical protein n=1 Tax=Luteolibacter sp. LG18 TaxID=2819286 RepID=UPI0030C754E9